MTSDPAADGGPFAADGRLEICTSSMATDAARYRALLRESSPQNLAMQRITALLVLVLTFAAAACEPDATDVDSPPPPAPGLENAAVTQPAGMEPADSPDLSPAAPVDTLIPDTL